MITIRDRMFLASRLLKGGSQDYLSIFYKDQIETIDKILKGEPYIAATYYVPGEILALFKINVLFIERISGFVAANNLYTHYLAGDGRKTCSYQKLFNSLLLQGILPRPELYICSNYACSDADSYCKRNGLRDHTEVYFIDMVSRNPSEVNTIADEIEGCFRFLEQKYEQIKDVKETFTLSNQAMIIKNSIDSHRKTLPGILHSSEALKIFMLFNDFGKDISLAVLKSIDDEIRRRKQHYQESPGLKLLWMGIIPLYHNQIIKEIEDRYHCKVVYEELFDFPEIVLDFNRPYISLAKKVMSTNYFTAANRIKRVRMLLEQYHANGIIHFSQLNCKFYPASVPAIKSETENNGVPFIEIQGDAIFKDGFNKGGCFDQLDVFFEIIGRKFCGAHY